MASYAIQLWLQCKWDMMLSPRHIQSRNLHGLMAATKGKLELEYILGHFFLLKVFMSNFSYFNHLKVKMHNLECLFAILIGNLEKKKLHLMLLMDGQNKLHI